MSDTISIERFEPRPCDELVLEKDELLGVFVDCESTGKDPLTEAITELSLVQFAFTPDGRISQYAKARVYLNDPGRPIPAEVVKITGITDDMVKGKRLPEAEISELVANAAIVISHNAEFDRQLLEAQGLSVFKHVRWACSYRDIPWRDEYGCSKLVCLVWQHLLMFYDAHRADVDCYAGVSLLTTTVPKHNGKRALAYLLDATRTSHARVFAIGAPFHVKEALKIRGYRAHYDGGTFQYWYRDVLVGNDYVEEMSWLRAAGVMGAEAVSYNSRTRFSNRIERPKNKQQMELASVA